MSDIFFISEGNVENVPHQAFKVREPQQASTTWHRNVPMWWHFITVMTESILQCSKLASNLFTCQKPKQISTHCPDLWRYALSATSQQLSLPKDLCNIALINGSLFNLLSSHTPESWMMAKYILRWLFTYEQSKCYSHVHINRNHVRLFWWPTTLYLEKLITASRKISRMWLFHQTQFMIRFLTAFNSGGSHYNPKILSS